MIEGKKIKITIFSTSNLDQLTEGDEEKLRELIGKNDFFIPYADEDPTSSTLAIILNENGASRERILAIVERMENEFDCENEKIPFKTIYRLILDKFANRPAIES